MSKIIKLYEEKSNNQGSPMMIVVYNDQTDKRLLRLQENILNPSVVLKDLQSGDCIKQV